MSLTEKDIEKLDWKSEHGATLETHELLEVLAKIAEDPEAYSEAEFDAGYTRAEQLANALRGMMGGLRAAEIAKTFKRAVKARAACEKYDLVPRATLEAARTQTAADASFGLGDPFPDPPPTKAAPLTGQALWGTLCAVYKNEYASWDVISKTNAEIMERLAVILNEKRTPIGIPDPLPPTKAGGWTGETLYTAYARKHGPNRRAWSDLPNITRLLFNAEADRANMLMASVAP